MSFVLDLSSYKDAREHAEEILERLEDGTMPCDGPWSEKDVTTFRAWVDSGLAP